MSFKLELVRVLSLPNQNKYGLYYGNLCIFSDKSLETVDEQYAKFIKYGPRAYRLIGDFYANIGNNKEYFAWMDLHNTLLKFIKLDGIIENDQMLANHFKKMQREITDNHLEHIQVYYPNRLL